MKQVERTNGKILLDQIMAAKQFLALKASPMRSKSERKPAYKPGTLKLSAVSEAIIRDHGRHVRRRVRKMIARRTSKPMKRYYNV